MNPECVGIGMWKDVVGRITDEINVRAKILAECMGIPGTMRVGHQESGRNFQFGTVGYEKGYRQYHSLGSRQHGRSFAYLTTSRRYLLQRVGTCGHSESDGGGRLSRVHLNPDIQVEKGAIVGRPIVKMIAAATVDVVLKKPCLTARGFLFHVSVRTVLARLDDESHAVYMYYYSVKIHVYSRVIECALFDPSCKISKHLQSCQDSLRFPRNSKRQTC